MGGRGSPDTLSNRPDAGERIIIVDPVTGKEYQVFKKTRGGILIYYTEGGRVVSGEISRMIGSSHLPARLKGQIDSILIIPDAGPDPEHTLAVYDDHAITVYQNQTLDAGEFAHELAHGLSEELWGGGGPPEGSAYRDAIDSGEPPVSAYGGRNPEEDFAEAVRMYIEDPELLADIAPLRYAAIRDIMNP